MNASSSELSALDFRLLSALYDPVSSSMKFEEIGSGEDAFLKMNLIPSRIARKNNIMNGVLHKSCNLLQKNIQQQNATTTKFTNSHRGKSPLVLPAQPQTQQILPLHSSNGPRMNERIPRSNNGKIDLSMRFEAFVHLGRWTKGWKWMISWCDGRSDRRLDERGSEGREEGNLGWREMERES